MDVSERNATNCIFIVCEYFSLVLELLRTSFVLRYSHRNPSCVLGLLEGFQLSVEYYFDF